VPSRRRFVFYFYTHAHNIVQIIIIILLVIIIINTRQRGTVAGATLPLCSAVRRDHTRAAPILPQPVMLPL